MVGNPSLIGLMEGLSVHPTRIGPNVAGAASSQRRNFWPAQLNSHLLVPIIGFILREADLSGCGRLMLERTSSISSVYSFCSRLHAWRLPPSGSRFPSSTHQRCLA